MVNRGHSFNAEYTDVYIHVGINNDDDNNNTKALLLSEEPSSSIHLVVSKSPFYIGPTQVYITWRDSVDSVRMAQSCVMLLVEIRECGSPPPEMDITTIGTRLGKWLDSVIHS